MKFKNATFLTVIMASLFACNEDNTTVETSNAMQLASHSKTPVLLSKKTGFENLEIYSLLSSEDKLSGSPDFVYGSMADGCGLMSNPDGTFSLINNIEAHYSVARIQFDKNLKPIKGEHILNSTATGNTAMCSGTLVTPEEHGFGPLYLSGGEWGGGMKNVFATDPYKSGNFAGLATVLPSLGQFDVENAVPLGKNAFSNKTVVLIGNDKGYDDAPKDPLAMYVGDRGDLAGGKLYGLKVNAAGFNFEVDMQESTEYNVDFVEITERSYSNIQTEVATKGITGFSRVEDIDYRKGSAENNREFYFTATGRKKPGLVGKGTTYGRVYKVVLDPNNPLKGKITCILDGDKANGKAKMFHSPDNITVTNDYVYIQEDPNGYPDNADKTHFACLYQYNIKTGVLKTVLEINQTLAESKGYGPASILWELTGMIDVSDKIGVPGSFLIITQNHGWTNNNFFDPKAILNPTYKEGSQLYLIKGLER